MRYILQFFNSDFSREGTNLSSIDIYVNYLTTKLCSVQKETTFWVGHFTTISGHFISNYINIFHKT